MFVVRRQLAGVGSLPLQYEFQGLQVISLAGAFIPWAIITNSVRSPGAGVTRNFKLPDAGGGNQTQVSVTGPSILLSRPQTLNPAASSAREACACATTLHLCSLPSFLIFLKTASLWSKVASNSQVGCLASASSMVFTTNCPIQHSIFICLF